MLPYENAMTTAPGAWAGAIVPPLTHGGPQWNRIHLERGCSVSVLEDGFGRRFCYLRLSITEACNFSCTYCLPDGYRRSGAHDFLSPEEISRLIGAFVRAGVCKVRLTGGEPAVRKDLDAIISRVARSGVEKIALTTNGWSLEKKVADWRAAGLTHLNVSVDSLDAGVFARVTGHDRLPSILTGLERALDGGFTAVKLNAVLLRGTVGDGFDAYADYVRARPVSVRFIELMRTGDNADYFAAEHVSGAVLRDWLKVRGWSPRAREGDDGPAVEFSHPDYLGRFGLIAPYAPGFCDGCNRLRVTARGRLRLCLFGDGGLDLRDLLQSNADQDALIARIRTALGAKPQGHRLGDGDTGATRRLAQVGG